MDRQGSAGRREAADHSTAANDILRVRSTAWAVVYAIVIAAVSVGAGEIQRVEAAPVINAAEAEEIRFMLRSSSALATANDAILDEALLKPYSSGLTWLQAFGVIVAADKVVERLQNEEYGAAALEAWLAATSLKYGGQLRGATFPASFGYLASAPIELSLQMFAERAFDAALNRQLAFYLKARSSHRKSHEFIIAGQSDDEVLFTDRGWIYLVGDASAPSYAPRIPSPTYTPVQVFELGKAIWDARQHQVDVARQESLLLQEFGQMVSHVSGVGDAAAPDVAATATRDTVMSTSNEARLTVALLGTTSGAERYRILHNLNAANRIASGLTVADLNAIIVGMEDQRAKVISLMARKLQPNLSAADVVALSGDTRGSTRYTILHNLNAANRIASGLTVADLNAIIAGMEDQRAKVISLMAGKLQLNLSAADVVASGAIGGTVPTTASPLPPAGPPRPGVLGGCGSTKWQRLAVPEYVCFSPYGGTLPWVNLCNIALTTGYRPVYFGEACRAHDICYGSAGARKSQCDQNFLTLLRATCDETLVGQLWSLGRRNCHNASSEFYHQVSTNGCDPFVNAQTNAGTATPACD